MKKSAFGRTFFGLAEAVIELAKAGFDVSIAALCDYALNGLLQLSVLLSGPTPVRFGQLDQSSPAPEVILISSEEEERAVLAFLATCREAERSPTDRTSESRSRWEMVWLPPSSGSIVPSEFQRHLDVGTDDKDPWHLVDLYYEVEEISGVVNLCLLGDERRMISDLRYQPFNNLKDARYGIFVRTSEGQLCQLQERSDEKAVRERARRRSQELERFIAAKNLPKEKADELRQWIEGEHMERMFYMSEVSSLGDYMPAAALPERAEIGVRLADLASLIQALKNQDAPAEAIPANDKGPKKSRREADAPGGRSILPIHRQRCASSLQLGISHDSSSLRTQNSTIEEIFWQSPWSKNCLNMVSAPMETLTKDTTCQPSKMHSTRLIVRNLTRRLNLAENVYWHRLGGNPLLMSLKM